LRLASPAHTGEGCAPELASIGRVSKGWLFPIAGGSGASGLADVAQLAERVLGKDEVTGSIPVIGSSSRR
jgi:hypothetical protein